MKFCPYCGASLVESAASFCTECGKKLAKTQRQEPAAPEKKQRPKTVKRPPQKQVRKPPAPQQHKNNKRAPTKTTPQRGKSPTDKGKKKPRSQKPHARPPDERRKPVNPMDIGYDGYYDDVLPEDSGQLNERMSPGLIRQIALVAAGTVVIVILAVVLMSVL